MTNILTLTKRELFSYFCSPLAYVIMTAFLFFSGYFFYWQISAWPDANGMRDILGLIGFVSLIIAPMITMRLLAEEKRTGTLEMLMTAPVTETEVVVSKFLAAWGFYLFLVIPMIAYIILLKVWGNPDLGVLAAGYLGLVLLAGVYLAVGLFVSSFTSNQIVAAIITFVILIIGWVIGVAAEHISAGIIKFINLIFGWLFGNLSPTSPMLTKVIDHIGLVEHFEVFRKGLIDSRDVIYYLSLIVFFLFLTVRIIESRRWR